MDVWPTIHAERAALADDLEGLSDHLWNTPSLCAGWTVRDVLAHMTATTRVSPLTFLPKLAMAGFSLPKMQNKDIEAVEGATPKDTLAAFRASVKSTKAPPGPKVTWLGEAIVHAEDIRRPLSIEHQYPTDAVVEIANLYTSSNLIIGGKKRIEGLTLRATDGDWTHGEGPEVAGPILSLTLAISGRHAAVHELTGDGVETLHSRH